MNDIFEELREKLYITIEQYGLNSDKTRKISDKFDKLINAYYKNEVQYSEDSIIYIKYIESIKAIKKITKDFSKFPTVEE